MKRWLATLLVFAVCSAVVRADVTIVQTTTVEGGMAAMAGGSMPSPKITVMVKGLKSRSDIEVANANTSSITDLAAMQVILLRHDQKTAQIVTPSSQKAAAPTVSIAVDGSMTPTGKSRVIDGFKCDEFTFTTSVSLGEMGGAQMPPEAAAMMKDVTMLMKGSVWVTKDLPGAAEFGAFQKALGKSDLTTAAMSASGVRFPGMDRMLKAMASIEGVGYLTEIDMTIDGTGEMAAMMKQMGGMKITTKTTSVKTDAVSDDLFKVPEGYTVVK
jgi:hypothetical protein